MGAVGLGPVGYRAPGRRGRWRGLPSKGHLGRARCVAAVPSVLLRSPPQRSAHASPARRLPARHADRPDPCRSGERGRTERHTDPGPDPQHATGTLRRTDARPGSRPNRRPACPRSCRHRHPRPSRPPRPLPTSPQPRPTRSSLTHPPRRTAASMPPASTSSCSSPGSRPRRPSAAPRPVPTCVPVARSRARSAASPRPSMPASVARSSPTRTSWPSSRTRSSS